MNTAVPSLLILNQPSYSPATPMDPRVEMFQKGHPKDPFFNMKARAPRPMSDATEMFDTDFEDDQSEIEDNNSPRLSINSVSAITLHSSPPLTVTYRAANKVARRYLLLKKYIRQVPTPTSSEASTSASPLRLR
jgi:hypothetical protein